MSRTEIVGINGIITKFITIKIASKEVLKVCMFVFTFNQQCEGECPCTLSSVFKILLHKLNQVENRLPYLNLTELHLRGGQAGIGEGPGKEHHVGEHWGVSRRGAGRSKGPRGSGCLQGSSQLRGMGPRRLEPEAFSQVENPC